MNKVLLFAKIKKADYENIIKKLSKRYGEDYINKVFSYYEKSENVLLYDETSLLTGEDINFIGKHINIQTPNEKTKKYNEKNPIQVGVIQMENDLTREVMSIFVMDKKIAPFKSECCNANEFTKKKDAFISAQKTNYRILIKRELAKIYFKQLHNKPTLKQKAILDEILDQILVCEEMGCGLKDTQIRNWLLLDNERQVQIKAHTLKFSA